MKTLTTKHMFLRHIGNPNIWEKLSCQPFSIPNCQFANFPSSTFGCFCLRFSRNGLFLAAACQERIGGYLKIFTVPRCKFRSCIFAHNEIIYDIDWNIDSKYIVTCSADYTAK
ncbi:hypothetical protein A3Q56_03877 [Intoshia linei]|uniref:Uncharacterized protein n=1 Tax=Intoshia linei TaxID=1819745 RepID=A0A177B3U2_9BILA|nr:hypothetical protein A3Q56_03877 [Intoshia linei]